MTQHRAIEENENCDDFYEVRVYQDGSEVLFDLNSWDCYACPDAAIEAAKNVAKEFDYVQVTSHGNFDIMFRPVEEGAVIWDSRKMERKTWLHYMRSFAQKISMSLSGIMKPSLRSRD